ncbi:uncharacterized protein si:dkey-262k9.2 isoform X4 [Girardinichthys multiradiatus]|uniref:uncharacterized protein si:dkey-262k9.2 isoform X4 n=1 Tax=Girardinichthys multiradiatus TaxID=208333 RepID=UPI001FADBBC8|nr:uncharacterized protein si:dkey-262k9.2 isoform X4 [Girardinichthys multiradiatus]
MTHLKMMRLLFLCVLLLLPAATVHSEEFEGSANDSDDEDLDEINGIQAKKKMTEETSRTPFAEGSQAENKSQENDGQTALIISVAVVASVVLLVTAITAIMLKKRQKLKQQQGIYSIPTEQNQKEAI